MSHIRFLTALAAASGLAAASPAFAASRFETLHILDPKGGEIEIGVWSPARPANPRAPLVVMSHGNGGFYGGAADTAEALADAGIVAAALTHTGDNFRDQSRATDMANRPRQLTVLTDYMLATWHGSVAIAPGRDGAFGFSSSGFTVLSAAGAEMAEAAVVKHCMDGGDRFYDCRLTASHSLAPGSLSALAHDPRLKSIVAAAPALGFAFTDASLKGIRIPVQLWRAEQDQVLPSPFYVEPIRDRLATKVDYHVVPGAGHYDFLPPCAPALATSNPEICTSRPGLDRAAFHRDFNREVVRFFRETLRLDPE
jgi:predicted dienelactone hydrolase